jgi:hypothetical protein
LRGRSSYGLDESWWALTQLSLCFTLRP